MIKLSRDASLVALCLALAAPAFAAPASEGGVDDPAQAGNDIIVTGTRRAERTVADSSAPIDVVGRNELGSVPSADLNDKLTQLIPSFNVQRLPGADGASFVRPATLRSLSADQTLVLINGKRRHRSAYIDITPQRGAQASDLSQIPEIALKRVEVLRDGASAQYGSDAIAGVVNLILADDLGYAATAQIGQFYKGDGFGTQIAARAGLRLSGEGTINISGEFSHANATDRSPAPQRIGQPENRNYRAFYNLKQPLGEGVELYSFGNYGHSWAEVDFSVRTPYLPQFPNGFVPHFASTTEDYSTVTGLRGDITDKLTWDLSGRYGRNRIRYHIYNTVNESLGASSPTDFHPGSQTQTEIGANLDFNYLLDAGLAAPINIAFGGEYQRQTFRLGAGDPASYVVGTLPYPAGSNGYPGVNPVQAGTWHLSDQAAYVDVDADITRRLNVSAAVRYEHYSSFGATTNFKLSGRYGITDFLNLRGTVSTGFHAPTPGQSNITSTQQGPDTTQPGPPYPIATRALIPPTSAVAAAFGGSALRPEKSTNYSVGAVLHPGSRFTLTVDAYRIDIRNRIGLLPFTKLTDTERAALVAAGISAASTLDQYRFFINGLKTRTQGIDAVATYAAPLGEGTLHLTAAYNHNETKIKKADPRFTALETYQFYEHHLPRNTATLSASYDIGRANLFARGRYYGSWRDVVFDTPLATLNQKVSPEAFLDLAVSYRITDHVGATVGVQNVLNNYPDKTGGILRSIGNVYPFYRPYEADGGQYYLRLSANF